MRTYLELTKPTIMLLVTFTGATALVVEGSLLSDPISFVLVLVGLFLTGGAANSLNQYLEREIDAKMTRTAGRRPLPTGRIKPVNALIFSILIGVAGVLLFALYFNLLTAALALGNILFYGLFYTLYLKPTTPQNIVIGGIAGAMAPVGAWTAATGGLDALPLLMFLIIFLWTPPHFWTLAIRLKDDYKKAGLPMYPLVKGDQAALDSIFRYTVVLFFLSLSLVFFGMQWLYFTVALLLGIIYLFKTWVAKRETGPHRLIALFRFSLIYLFGLFTAIIVDSFV